MVALRLIGGGYPSGPKARAHSQDFGGVSGYTGEGIEPALPGYVLMMGGYDGIRDLNTTRRRMIGACRMTLQLMRTTMGTVVAKKKVGLLL